MPTDKELKRFEKYIEKDGKFKIIGKKVFENNETFYYLKDLRKK